MLSLSKHKPDTRIMTNPRKDQLISDDKRYIWHPFTQMRDWEADEPLVIERGKGCRLFDVDGNSYIDGVSSLWVTVHGHRKKEIDDAVIRQVRTLAHSTFLGLTHPTAIELAKKLVEITPPGLERVFYSDNGSTAVEIGLKMVFQYRRQNGEPRRTKFVCLDDAYHGDTIGSVSVGGMELFHDIFRPLLFDTIKAPAPHCYRCGLGLTPDSCGMACADEMERLVSANADEVAGILVEPLVQGAAGMYVHPAGYLKRVREICDRYDVFMIADEVATGFGRTGTMFACRQEGVSPDVLCCAKGITGGYLPLAATLTTGRIYDGFLADYSEFRTFFHGHTYTANPLACAAAIANIGLFEKEDTLGRMHDKYPALEAGLAKIAALPNVGDVRRKGFMIGIELVKDKKTREAYPLAEKRGMRATAEARRLGAIIRPLGNTVVLMPPLAIPERELKRLLKIAKEAVERATG